MQIAYWQPEQPLDGCVFFETARLSSYIDAAVLQALENRAWQAERPLSGRMGAR